MRLVHLLPLVFAWVILGCDSVLSRWDRVHVEVSDPETPAATDGTDGVGDPDGTSTDGGSSTGGTTTGGSTTGGMPDTVLPVVDAGADVLTNAAFSRTGKATDASSLTYLWEKSGGVGTVTFSAPTSLTTTISASTSAVYTIKLTATDAAGNQGVDTFTLNWDVTAPSPPAVGTLKIAADSAVGTDATIDDDADVYFIWGAATDGPGAGIMNYTVAAYSQANCAGAAVETPAVVGTSLMSTGADAQTLSFKVKAVDNLSQVGAYSACKSGIKIDLVDPDPLQNFAVVAGSTLATATVGTNEVTVNFPDSGVLLADYKSVTVRRKKGATPASTCDDGEVAKMYTTPTFPDPDTFLDYTNDAGASFDYRVCITDAAGRTTSSDVVTARTSKPHILFATATGYAGDLGGAGGLSGADSLCNTTAHASSVAEVQNETYWKAVLSDSTTSARNRLGVFGVVKDWSLLATLADDYNGFWFDPLQTFVEPDGGGFPEVTAITGSTRNGMHGGLTETCNDWTSNAGANKAWVGDTNGGAPWLNTGAGTPAATASCSSNYSIYCLSQPPPPPAIVAFSALTPTGATTGLNLKIDLPPDTSRYFIIHTFYKVGATAPNAECDNNNGGTTGVDFYPITGTTMTVNEPGLAHGATYAYRACVFDAFGNIITTTTATGIAN